MPITPTEQSLTGGNPVELYRFTGLNEEWFYTSYDKPLTFPSGNTYDPIAIKRNTLQIGTQERNEIGIEVTMPFDTDIAQDYAYRNAPPRLDLTIFRLHADDLTKNVTYFKGRVTGITVKGKEAKFKIPSLFGYVLESSMPRVHYQRPCNHVLYDSRCKVRVQDYVQSHVVYSVVRNVITCSRVGTNGEKYFEGGKMYAADNLNANTEQRTIKTRTRTATRDIYTLNYPFNTDLSPVGNNRKRIRVVPGCDHALHITANAEIKGDCATRFGNTENYGGFLFVPDINPFIGRIV